MLLKITSVDMNGFLGRENHPHPSDVGLVVRTLSMLSEVVDRDYDHVQVFASPVDKLDPITIVTAQHDIDERNFNDGPHILHCWTCVTHDGRLLDLMDFEVELFRS